MPILITLIKGKKFEGKFKISLSNLFDQTFINRKHRNLAAGFVSDTNSQVEEQGAVDVAKEAIIPDLQQVL